MSRWDDALDWLKQPVSRSLPSGNSSTQQAGGYAAGHEPPDEQAERGRVHTSKARRQARKQGIDRRTSLPPELDRAIRNAEGAPKPYDPAFLKEIASHPVAQAYIDTMAQDAATAPWSITQRDERVEIQDEALAEAERTIEGLHPEKSFRDLKEMAARGTLTLGDGAWVLHFYEGTQDLAEAVPVDTQRLYKRVDEHGFTQGYLEVSHTRRNITGEFDLEEVVWFDWASEPGGTYGTGPVQKGAETLEVLEELSEKELKDLTEGMPPGIVSVKEDEDTPMAVDAYENVRENWGLREGERHRAIVSMGDWQFTPLSPGYQELQFLERNKFWIHVMGAVFKVNAPYAGFDFQEGNMAQNMAQHEAQAQRGFRVLLRQMEEAINRQLVWPHISEDIQFEFEMERSISEQQEHAQHLQALGEAAEQWVSLGRNVSFRDGTIEIEDGEVEEPEQPAGGGGLFGSADPQEQPAQASEGATVKAVDLAAAPGTEVLADGALGQWHTFLEQVAVLGGQVENLETGATYPPEQIPPARSIVVHGLDAAVVRAALEQHEGVQYNVKPRDDATRAGKGSLTREQYEKADDLLLEAHKSQIWPETLEDVEKRAWGGDGSVPEYVIENISEAINSAGAVFQDIQGIPANAQKRLESLLEDNLTQEQGWSLRSIVEDMQDVWPGVPKEDLEVVARTETASVLNEAREIGYESFEGAGDDRFYWQGPSDSRTTDACEELKERTNPQHGGTPVSMNEMVRMQQEVQQQHFPSLSFRKHTIHPNERHTFVRQVAAAIDEGGF